MKLQNKDTPIQKISDSFEKLEALMDKILPLWLINGTLRFTFSKTSTLFHTVWFVYWFAARLDVGLLTNIVSLEAIYIGILIGIQQTIHHTSVKNSVMQHLKQLKEG